MHTIRGIAHIPIGNKIIILGGPKLLGKDAILLSITNAITKPIARIIIATIIAQTSVFVVSSLIVYFPQILSTLNELKLFSRIGDYHSFPNDFSEVNTTFSVGEEMSLDDKFKEEMKDICEEYHNLLKQKKLIEEQLETLHNYLEVTMRKYEKEKYDDLSAPVIVNKIVYTSERMKKMERTNFESSLQQSNGPRYTRRNRSFLIEFQCEMNKLVMRSFL